MAPIESTTNAGSKRPGLRPVPSLQVPQSQFVDFLTSGYGYDDESVTAAVKKANHYFDRRELRKALDLYGAAYEIGRLHCVYAAMMHDLLIRRVFCLSMLGDFKRALYETDLALEVIPRSPTAYFMHGVVHSKLGNADEANSAFQQAVFHSRLLRDCADCIISLFLQGEGHNDRAIQICTKVLERSPKLPLALLRRGDAYKFHASGYYGQKAAADYATLLELDISYQPEIGQIFTKDTHARADELVLKFHPYLKEQGPGPYFFYKFFGKPPPFMVFSLVLIFTVKLKTHVKSTKLLQNVLQKHEELLQQRAAAEWKVLQVVEMQRKLAGVESHCEVWGPADPDHVLVRRYRRLWMERPLNFPARKGKESPGPGMEMPIADECREAHAAVDVLRAMIVDPARDNSALDGQWPTACRLQRELTILPDSKTSPVQTRQRQVPKMSETPRARSLDRAGVEVRAPVTPRTSSRGHIRPTTSSAATPEASGGQPHAIAVGAASGQHAPSGWVSLAERPVLPAAPVLLGLQHTVQHDAAPEQHTSAGTPTTTESQYSRHSAAPPQPLAPGSGRPTPPEVSPTLAPRAVTPVPAPRGVSPAPATIRRDASPAEIRALAEQVSVENRYVEKPPPPKLGHNWTEEQWVAKALELADVFAASGECDLRRDPRSPRRESPRRNQSPPRTPLSPSAVIRTSTGEVNLIELVEKQGIGAIPDWYAALDRIYETTDMKPFTSKPAPFVGPSRLIGAIGHNYVVPKTPPKQHRGPEPEIPQPSEEVVKRYKNRLLVTSIPGRRRPASAR